MSYSIKSNSKYTFKDIQKRCKDVKLYATDKVEEEWNNYKHMRGMTISRVVITMKDYYLLKYGNALKGNTWLVFNWIQSLCEFDGFVNMGYNELIRYFNIGVNEGKPMISKSTFSNCVTTLVELGLIVKLSSFALMSTSKGNRAVKDMNIYAVVDKFDEAYRITEVKIREGCTTKEAMYILGDSECADKEFEVIKKQIKKPLTKSELRFKKALFKNTYKLIMDDINDWRELYNINNKKTQGVKDETWINFIESIFNQGEEFIKENKIRGLEHEDKLIMLGDAIVKTSAKGITTGGYVLTIYIGSLEKYKTKGVLTNAKAEKIRKESESKIKPMSEKEKKQKLEFEERYNDDVIDDYDDLCSKTSSSKHIIKIIKEKEKFTNAMRRCLTSFDGLNRKLDINEHKEVLDVINDFNINNEEVSFYKKYYKVVENRINGINKAFGKEYYFIYQNVTKLLSNKGFKKFECIVDYLGRFRLIKKGNKQDDDITILKRVKNLLKEKSGNKINLDKIDDVIYV